MSEISHRDIRRHLDACRKNGFSSLYLVYGEPYLCQRVCQALAETLVPDADARQSCLEVIDAREGQAAAEAVESAGTFSFLPGPRVVTYKGPNLFSGKSGADAEQNKTAGHGANDMAILQAAVERGFPKNNYLIMVTEKADKRTRLFKAVSSSGTVVNCAVATGSRKAERDEQQQVLRQLAAETLGPWNKSLEPGAFEHIFSLTGFDPRSFVSSLEKLMLYTADRPRITAADASAVLEKTREDPIYLFTGALAERNVDLALYYLDSLLGSGYHPMQLLTAAANQVRRLLAVKSFVEDSGSTGVWRPSMPFDRFKSAVLPKVLDHDKLVAQYGQQVRDALLPPDESGKDKSPTDLLIAKNPKNPYPIYQVFLQSDRFTGRQLSRALAAVHQCDLAMKSTGRSPRAVLESLIFTTFAHDPETKAKPDQARKAR